MSYYDRRWHDVAVCCGMVNVWHTYKSTSLDAAPHIIQGEKHSAERLKGAEANYILARQTERDRERQRETERDRERQRETERDRERQRETESHEERQREKQESLIPGAPPRRRSPACAARRPETGVCEKNTPPEDNTRWNTVSFHNFESQNVKLSVSNPKSKYVAYLSVLSQTSNCQGLGRKTNMKF